MWAHQNKKKELIKRTLETYKKAYEEAESDEGKLDPKNDIYLFKIKECKEKMKK